MPNIRWVRDYLGVAAIRRPGGDYVVATLDCVGDDTFVICKADDRTTALKVRDVIVENFKPEAIHRLKDVSCEEILKLGGAK